MELRDILTVWGSPPAALVDQLPKPTKKDNPKGNCNVERPFEEPSDG